MLEGGSSSDPFIVTENWRADQWGNNAGYQDLTGKTLRSAAITGRTLILITAGDSNMAAVGPTPFTPINTNSVDNLNIYDGAVYNGADPMLGHSLSLTINNNQPGYGSIPPRLADKIMNGNLYDRVICVPLAIGGSYTAAWATGGTLFAKIPVALRRLAARGITPSTPNCTFCIVYQIGANEHGISVNDYQANVNSTINKAKAEGFVGKVFIPKYSLLNGVVDANIQTAELGLIDNVTFFNGGDQDALTGTAYRQADNTHFNAVGQNAAAQNIYNQMHAVGLA